MPKKEIAKKPESGPLIAPDFMVGIEDLGTEDLRQFLSPPRIKIIQKSTGPPLDDMFDIGEVIIVPQNVKVAGLADPKTGTPVFFVPLFFYPEWCLHNPFGMKATLPFIKERTTDPRDPMVAKSRSPSLWSIPCPENPEYKCRYVEHLNFIVLMIGEHELVDTPLVLSFSKAEHRSGSNFAALIQMRKAPIYGCQFQATSTFRPGDGRGTWFGIDVTNPAGDSKVTPFCQDKERFAVLQNMHAELKKAHEQSKIRVKYDADDAAPPPGDAKNEF